MRKYSLVLLKEEIIMLETAMQMEKKMDEMVHLVTAQIGAEDIPVSYTHLIPEPLLTIM